MARKAIEMSAGIEGLVAVMGESNPGATGVLARIVAADPVGALITLLNLDDMNMRGPQIWAGYKDFAGQDLGKFIDGANDRDPEMIKVVNAECIHPDFTEEAGAGGASFTR